MAEHQVLGISTHDGSEKKVAYSRTCRMMSVPAGTVTLCMASMMISSAGPGISWNSRLSLTALAAGTWYSV